MRTITIEIINDIALQFLHNLENLKVIKLISDKTTSKQKLSERFSGCISKEKTEELQQELNKMRNEWERNI
jgi:HAMP domain-containing protein